MIAIVDYGVGNLFSLKSSLAAIGYEAVVTGDADTLRRADKILLPGVGAFGDAADKLRATGLDAVIVDEAKSGKPLMGICLGMQLLFDRGFEYGEHAGLGPASSPARCGPLRTSSRPIIKSRTSAGTPCALPKTKALSSVTSKRGTACISSIPFTPPTARKA